MELTGLNHELDMYLTESKRSQAALEQMQKNTNRAAQSDTELREACQTFESYFLQIMFREMRKTSFTEGTALAKSRAEQIFTDMLDEEVSKSAALSGGIGLAEMMYQQMKNSALTSAFPE